MTSAEQIDQFLAASAFAVVGASTNRHKFGNKVLRCYQNNGRKVTPVHPREEQIEGVNCVTNVAELPNDIASISIITPPQITEEIVKQVVAKGIHNVWMQPGAESPAAIEFCQKHKLNVIADGSCLLVVLR